MNSTRNIQFGEEELNAFEIGFKSSLMDGLARLNASAYYNDYKDFQAFTIVSLATNVVSAPDAESIGFETELFLLPRLDGPGRGFRPFL